MAAPAAAAPALEAKVSAKVDPGAAPVIEAGRTEQQILATPDMRMPAPPSPTRWLASATHVPLAMADKQGLHPAPAHACAEWADRGERWRALDAFGKVVGLAEVVGGRRNGENGCSELTMKTLKGKPGVGLYVSESGIWQAPASVSWTPTAAERDALLTLTGRKNAGKDALQPMFFRAGKSRYAIVGGRSMALARHEGGRKWTLVNLHEEFVKPMAGAILRPMAAIDLDSDGIPEVVVRREAGKGKNDFVLRLDPQHAKWETVASTVKQVMQAASKLEKADERVAPPPPAEEETSFKTSMHAGNKPGFANAPRLVAPKVAVKKPAKVKVEKNAGPTFQVAKADDPPHETNFVATLEIGGATSHAFSSAKPMVKSKKPQGISLAKVKADPDAAVKPARFSKP